MQLERPKITKETMSVRVSQLQNSNFILDLLLNYVKTKKVILVFWERNDENKLSLRKLTKNRMGSSKLIYKIKLYLYISLFLYLSISLFLYLSVSLSLCFSISLFLYLSVSLSLCFSISLFLYLSVSLSLCFSISLFLYLYYI